MRISDWSSDVCSSDLGFAVVAQEVRALAQRSADASRDIKGLIQASTGEVREGARLVNQTGQSLTEIVTAVKKVADIIGEISSARSEEHTSELQSLMRISYAVFCLKKKRQTYFRKTKDEARKKHKQ